MLLLISERLPAFGVSAVLHVVFLAEIVITVGTFEMGLRFPEVAVISGHKDARMLFRYTQLRAENIIAELG